MGENGCVIDNDSQLRGNKLTNKIHQSVRSKTQLRIFGKGPYKVDVESQIRDSLVISDKRTQGCFYA